MPVYADQNAAYKDYSSRPDHDNQSRIYLGYSDCTSENTPMERFLEEPCHEHGIAFIRPVLEAYPGLERYIEDASSEVVETERSETKQGQKEY